MSDAGPMSEPPLWKRALSWLEILAWIGVSLFLLDRLGPQLSALTGIEVGATETPSFVATTLAGDTLSADGLRGEVAVVNFWATWCGPCRLEMPALQGLHEDYAERGVTVLGLSTDVDGSAIPPFLEERGITYPVGRATPAQRQAFGGVRGIPTTLILDREGRVRHRVVGYFAPPAMRAAVERLLAEEVPGEEAEPDVIPTTPASATPPLPASVTWTPQQPNQGSLLRVTLQSPDRALASVEGTLGGEALRFHAPRSPTAATGELASLAPVPVDAEDPLTATLIVRYRDGGEERLPLRIPVGPGDFRHEALQVAPEFGSPLTGERRARLDRDIARAAAVSRAAMDTPPLWSAEAVLPRPARVTSGFGNGRVFNGQVSSRHMGLDLDGATGDTVRAPTRGVVELVDDFLLAGSIVYLNHGGGLVSGYFHLSDQLVSAGDTVRSGQPIGRVGATGRVTGPHLHWVVRYGRTSLDPRSLLEVLSQPRRGAPLPR